MKGYFSRLTQQSGLRYGQANAGAPAAKNDSAPPHREETILVAPVAPEINAPRTKKIESFPTAKFSTEKPPLKIEESIGKNLSEINSAENIFADEFSEETKPAAPPAKIFDAPVQKNHPAAQIQNEILKKNSASGQTEIAPAEFPVIEQTVDAEGGAASGKISPTEPRIQIDSESEFSVRAETESVPRTEYFKKTAANLEAGATDKSEARQTLLQEIFEWVSDAPTDDAPVQTSREDKSKKTNLKRPDENRIVVSAPLEEYFNDESSPVEQRAASEIGAENRQPLEEQNFNLSIGTISIVVEEPPPVQTTMTEKPPTEKTAATATREYSRLNRHYL